MNFDRWFLQKYLEKKGPEGLFDTHFLEIVQAYHTARIADALERITEYLENGHMSTQGMEEGFKGVERLATLFEEMKAESEEEAKKMKAESDKSLAGLDATIENLTRKE